MMSDVMFKGGARRRLLASGLVAGGGVLAASFPAKGAGAAAADPSSGSAGNDTPDTGAAHRGGTGGGQAPSRLHAGASGGLRLFADAGFNFSALTALGMAAYGVSEVGEVLAAVDTINAAGASYETYTGTFLDWGERLVRQSAGSSNRITEGRLALRASQCYAQALFYVLGTTRPQRELEIYRACRRNWDSFVASLGPTAEFFTIPYGAQRLPAWFFRPHNSSERRPTVILTNGSDGQAVDLWSWGAAAALEHGWNALIYDGPGQGELLFEQKLPFSTEWEKVVGPIVDYLLTRPDVDGGRIALTGLSMGGNLVARAAAFEHRLAAVVAEPGVTSPWLGFPAGFRKAISEDRNATNQVWNDEIVPALRAPEAAEPRFLLAKRYEPFGAEVLDAVREGRFPTDIWTPSQIVDRLDVTGVVSRIRCPSLVLDYEGEQFYPGQPEKLFSLLTGPRDYVKFTAAEGADLHCSPKAPRRHNELIFEWLVKTLQ